jgi:3-oxoacyl-[acyl-carrier protein] reductase
MASYNEIQVGQVAEIVHAISNSDLLKFVELTGDDNRLHVDAAFAATTSFKKPVAHGMLGASFISTVIGTKLPGDGALWFSQSLEFLLPVRVGDILTIRAEVLRKEDRSRIIELQTDITNQHKQKVTQGIAKVKVIEQELTLTNTIQIHKPIALVIGGTGGIGSATCLALADAGFDIAIHYFKNVSAADKLAEKINTTGRKSIVCSCNIADQVEVNDLIDLVIRKLGPPIILVNCSTVKITPIKLNSLNWSDFESHINNQLRGTFNLVHAITPLMEKQGYGKIVNLDTQYVDAPESNLIPYITAKGGLRALCKALALDLAPKGIRVNSVSPGMTNTDQIADVPERIRMITAAKTPLKRLATPEDIANTIVFLASPKSDFLCGEIIRVNGGQLMF